MFTIEIPIKAVPKKRPRFSRKSGSVYTPKESQDFELMIALYIKRSIKTPISGPLKLEIDFIFKRSKSSKLKFHTKKPDIDNLEKSVLDGLNKVAFNDDSQVIDIHSRKKLSNTRDFIRIKITTDLNESDYDEA